MKIFVLVILALIALSVAQIPICYKVQCNGKNGICDTIDTTKYIVTGCKSSLSCVIGTGTNGSGTCQTDSKLLQGCASDGAACTDSKYDITCSGGICLYPPALGPGDNCAVTVANYVNSNPCAETTTCSSTCSGSVVASGGSCDDVTKVCASGLYCARNSGNGTCQSRLSSGQACSGTSNCAWNLVCTNRGSGNFTCQSAFGQSAGQKCSSGLDCAANLFCDPSNGQCASASQQNAACTVSDPLNRQGSCPSGYQCICRHGSAGSTNGQCFTSVVSSSLVKDLNSYWNCMGANCNFDINAGIVSHTVFVVGYTPDACAAKKCSGQVSSLNKDFASYLGSTGACGAASAISVLAFLLVSLVSAILML